MYWLIKFYRRLRNLDALEDAYAATAVALTCAAEGQRLAYASAEQLQTCRLILAATMRERDGLEAALTLAEAELRKCKLRERRERENCRYWLTRTIRPQKASAN